MSTPHSFKLDSGQKVDMFSIDGKNTSEGEQSSKHEDEHLDQVNPIQLF